eukprot:scaffold39409_cov36-Phaeocystis_antarctica.AAC.1
MWSPRPTPSNWSICCAQSAHRLGLQTATLSLQTGRFKRPVCRLYATQAWFTNRNPVCKLRPPSLQTNESSFDVLDPNGLPKERDRGSMAVNAEEGKEGEKGEEGQSGQK